MRPYTVDKIVSWTIGTAMCLMLILTLELGSSLAAKAATPCQTSEARAVALAPNGTVFLTADPVAFRKIYDRYNMQRMSMGHGFTLADKIVVTLFRDRSIVVFMTWEGCLIKSTISQLDIPKWKAVLDELGLTARNFSRSVKAREEISL